MKKIQKCNQWKKKEKKKNKEVQSQMQKKMKYLVEKRSQNKQKLCHLSETVIGLPECLG